MGLIQAAVGALGGTLADQWKEFFYCESMNSDTLMTKGVKQTSNRSSNTKGNDNIITNGSGIAVADGQCMIIVDQGKIVEFCSEPGQFTFSTSSEPSIFAGNLGESIVEVFKTALGRFTYGGDTGKDQRIYYFNMKEIVGNKYGTPNPIPFRVVDQNIHLDLEVGIRCNGEYSYKITNPILFYQNVAGNVSRSYTRDQIDSTLKSELLTALQPAFARISEQGIRYSYLPGHTTEIAEALNDILSSKWKDLRGIEVASFGVNSVTASKEDEDRIKNLQVAATMRDPTMGAAVMTNATSEAMKAAASNANGAMTGFMGLGMAQQAGGVNTANLYAMGQQQAAQQAAQAAKPAADAWVCPECGATVSGKFCPECGAKKPSAKEEWVCPSCGTKATGKFCPECGAKKPEAAPDKDAWTCACGKVNTGKFCSECGAKKPEAAKRYRCGKCGYVPEDPTNPPKFCPECGDKFTAEDAE